MTAVPLPVLSLLLLAVTLSHAFPMFSDMENKIGGQRKLSLTAVVACFRYHNNMPPELVTGRRKKMYAATSGATAVLYDEDGNEVDCSAFANPTQHKYDQHCFFSPLNCFFSKYRLADADAAPVDVVVAAPEPLRR